MIYFWVDCGTLFHEVHKQLLLSALKDSCYVLPGKGVLAIAMTDFVIFMFIYET